MIPLGRAVAVTLIGVATVVPGAAAQAPDNIVGAWHRAQACEEMVAAFDSAGLLETHLGWAQGNFFPEGAGPGLEDPCAGAMGALEHAHGFSAEGEFWSTDEHGGVVDGGDYVVLSDGMLDFPSHAREFGFDGDVAVAFVIEDPGVASFDVLVPEGCTGACADAHAWANLGVRGGTLAAGRRAHDVGRSDPVAGIRLVPVFRLDKRAPYGCQR